MGFTWTGTEIVKLVSNKFEKLYTDIQFIKDELISIKEEIKKLKDKNE
jgi:hypothetical protein